MFAVPAPANVNSLRVHLMDAQIDVDHLFFHLEQYLTAMPAPSDDAFADPSDAHQQWDYQQTIRGFCDMIRATPDAGNGDEDQPPEPAEVTVL